MTARIACLIALLSAYAASCVEVDDSAALLQVKPDEDINDEGSDEGEDPQYYAKLLVKHVDGKEGQVIIRVHPQWAPKAAARFKELIDSKFLDDARFFRVIPGFMAQFGIPARPEANDDAKFPKILDDKVYKSNEEGFVTFATSGPNSRTTQMFINTADNSFLDKQGFAPFGKVVLGMSHIHALNAKYGEGGPRGHGPEQGRIKQEGNSYLQKDFPELSYITSVKLSYTGRDYKESAPW